VLAAASPAEVLREWQGLGYDRRALALWRAARLIESDHGGRVPDSIEALEALPGVGPYTARAVAALAFGQPVGAVDVNVRRVLGRIVAGGTERIPARDLQAVADAAVPPHDPGAWTHAVMDVGATVCRPRTPRCEACPARPWCRYAAECSSTSTVETATAETRTPRSRRRKPPFPTTTRWLRGRILDRLRAAHGDAWVALDAPVGTHDLARVRAAATVMAADGLIELDGNGPASGVIRARLTTT